MLQISESTQTIGSWTPESSGCIADKDKIRRAVHNIREGAAVIKNGEIITVATGGKAVMEKDSDASAASFPMLAWLPPLPPEQLGDPVFKKRHNLKYAYVAGAMANGITSVSIVKEMGKAGMIGFFGAAGLSPGQIENAIDALQAEPSEIPFGFNLIHTPAEPDVELSVVDLYLKKGVHLISAAAYMRLSLPLIYFRVKGIYRDKNNRIITPNRIIAKVSRVEVAQRFFSPPPEKILSKLLESGMITREEAELAKHIPVADDLTAEADSGGHTDNRPALALLPAMLALRDELSQKFGYDRPLCVGLAGGIATPESAAAAFSMGAAYILTGSVNQSCVEAGTSETVKQMLAQAGQADVTMAPSADMFEMGIKVQVLKRGTMFALRAGKLYELYRSYNSWDELPAAQKKTIEDKFFLCRFDEEWENTKAFFTERDPRQTERAEKDPKHKMALVFRSYLGRSSMWSINEDPARKMDYQIWCGPAMGAFNEWVKNSFLENHLNRKVVTVALNLLAGAGVLTRAALLRSQGILVSGDIARFRPLEPAELEKYTG